MTREPLTTAQIRQIFLTFFQRHQHEIVPSSSLVVANDPTLLFANSGMVQFKDMFLGLEQRPYTRATTAQKCLRVSGKHNDLEEVGPSPRHHTFFEMLGNFSFGDYFKADAIQMAWKLLTEDLGLPVERLWFTVFEGNEQVPADEEAVQLWIQAGAPPERILRFGEKDNFWVMADTGPCGPCSEITVYIGDDLDTMHAEGVNSDDPDYVEIWNLVFMQFERSTMQPLPRPSVDTGMGLERIAMVLQGGKSTYETDAFRAIIKRIIGLLGSDEAHYRANFAPYRAIADHSRAVAFLIADGVLPGNNGRSYVLRRILRRAVYQGRSIGFAQPFLAAVVETVLDDMSPAYPELAQRRAFILDTVQTEEAQFLRTLADGLGKLQTLIAARQASGATTISGADAFRLKDTDGFPLDLTQKIASEHGLEVDVPGFEVALEEQRARSRAAAQFQRTADAELWAEHTLPATTFLGYDQMTAEGRVLALVAAGDDVSAAQAGQQVQVVLDQSPCYAESGGQVGDVGTLVVPGGIVRVDDTQRPVPGLIVHYGEVEQGTIQAGDTATVAVNVARRCAIQRNHTATHLLHRALRDVLGDHAAQAGSLVAPERLRFDFTHTKALTPDELHTIEQRINAWVRADTPVSWTTTDYRTAVEQRGAMALFGEKYGDEVRVVSIPRTGAQPLPADDLASRDSVELCGGTHTTRTGEIGYAHIVSEGSVGSGLRRIEMVTGEGAAAWVDGQVATLESLAARLGTPPAKLAERLDSLLSETRQQQTELATLHTRLLRSSIASLLEQVQQVDNVPLLACLVDVPDAARQRDLGSALCERLGSGVVVLGAVIDDKPQVLAMLTADMVQRGYHAGKLVKELAGIVGGGGGGRPDMAQGGGRDPDKLDEALAQVPRLLAAQVRA